MACKSCGVGGMIFRRCLKCFQIWCSKCVRTGAGGYPNIGNVGNKCPYCKYTNKVQTISSENEFSKTHKHLLR